MDSAILNLTVIVKSGSNPSPVLVNKVTSALDTTTVTYATKPAFTPTSAQYAVLQSDLYQTIHIDITTIVNEWLSGATVNNGLALTNSDGTTVVQFATNNIIYEPYFPTLTLTYSESPVVNTGENFSYAQLSHIIEQLIALYPANTITVFTRGLTASSVTGTPYQLYKSSTGTYGAIFILMDGGQQEAIPLNAITAIYTGNDTVYNPSITYLTPPQKFAPGFDSNLITAYYEYLDVSTDVVMYMGSNINASGTVYKNEYGIIVLSDADGNTPIFIPVNNINVVLPALPSGGGSSLKSGIPKPFIEAKA
ncbi:MAG: hypothetical protein K0R50_4344 [Eubacterium sp.]|nr:hypothetical protein [Eubacterium sp.]